MRTKDGLAHPAGGELDMAAAVLAAALKMSFRFWHRLQPLYNAAGLVNTENCAIEACLLQFPRREMI
jgi:hypothetical protein